MGHRTYDQYCPVAAALDVVGDRWTLLIMRELLAGDRRFTDLRDRAARDRPEPPLRAPPRPPGRGARRAQGAAAAGGPHRLLGDGEGRSVVPVLQSLARFGVVAARGRPTTRTRRRGWRCSGCSRRSTAPRPTAAASTPASSVDGETFDIVTDGDRLSTAAAPGRRARPHRGDGPRPRRRPPGPARPLLLDADPGAATASPGCSSWPDRRTSSAGDRHRLRLAVGHSSSPCSRAAGSSTRGAASRIRTTRRGLSRVLCDDRARRDSSSLAARSPPGPRDEERRRTARPEPDRWAGLPRPMQLRAIGLGLPAARARGCVERRTPAPASAVGPARLVRHRQRSSSLTVVVGPPTAPGWRLMAWRRGGSPDATTARRWVLPRASRSTAAQVHGPRRRRRRAAARRRCPAYSARPAGSMASLTCSAAAQNASRPSIDAEPGAGEVVGARQVQPGRVARRHALLGRVPHLRRSAPARSTRTRWRTTSASTSPSTPPRPRK